MVKLGDRLWVFEGETVSFYRMPYSTRMTVVQLAGGDLWVHSPIRLSEQLKRKIDGLGDVAYLVAPNHLHHLFIEDWQRAYPEAQACGTQEVIEKRRDLTFDLVLTAAGAYPWAGDIEQELFTGSKAMEECVFFHPLSGTLIVTDLVENFSPAALKPWQRVLARGAGIVAPNGKMPLDWRLSFTFTKPVARTHLVRLLAWQPRTLVMAHGQIVQDGAVDFLKRSFKWLL